MTADATVYGFGLPRNASLRLPACACVLLKAPARGRGAKGKDDYDGSDAVRPYVPISSDAIHGKFELLVKRCVWPPPPPHAPLHAPLHAPSPLPP